MTDTRLLAFDPADSTRFGHEPFAVRHTLAAHPLFALSRLVELARQLPAAQVEYNAGNVPVSLDPGDTPRNGLSAEETVRRIAECNSWLVLKNVERDPEYGGLLARCLGETRRFAPRGAAGMRDSEAFIFVSSPGAVTPYHMDPEENFLLQIRGEKTMRVFEPRVLSQEELERFFTGAHRNLAYRDEYAAHGRAYRLQPGDGVHVPVARPHWVQNGPEVSVSFSVTARTAASARMAQAHRLNAGLRRWGIRPAPVGQSRLRDAAKQLVFRGWQRASRAF
jgi:hypothetical protein